MNRLRARWARVRDLFPLTSAGVLVASISLFSWLYYGLGKQDLVLLAVGSLGAIVVGVALVSVLIAGGVAALQLRGELVQNAPLELECGFPGRTGFVMPVPWWIPLVDVSWVWESPTVDVRLVPTWGRLRGQVTPLRRGLSDDVVRTITVRDAFGLASLRLRSRERRRLRFLPGRGKLRQMHVVQGMAGGDLVGHPEGSPTGDRFDMRHYTPGDPIRFVLWKVFAKSRQLVVRTPERALSPVRQTIAYLVTGPDDMAAAGAARVAVTHGALGDDWILGADGVAAPARGSVDQAMDVLLKSAATHPDGGGEGLQGFLMNAQPGSVRRAVLFVPPTPGSWLDRVAAATRGMQGPARLEVIVCTDGLRRDSRSKRVKRWLAAETPVGPSTKEVGEVVRRLAGVGIKVMILDRKTGQLFSEIHLQRMAS